jgi:hypothetical protein
MKKVIYLIFAITVLFTTQSCDKKHCPACDGTNYDPNGQPMQGTGNVGNSGNNTINDTTIVNGSNIGMITGAARPDNYVGDTCWILDSNPVDDPNSAGIALCNPIRVVVTSSNSYQVVGNPSDYSSLMNRQAWISQSFKSRVFELMRPGTNGFIVVTISAH